MNGLEAGLRDRLIDVGVELVTSGGTASVSLREIARRAGVSHGAPRRYFPTHLELLSAVARRGFASLGAEPGLPGFRGVQPRHVRVDVPPRPAGKRPAWAAGGQLAAVPHGDCPGRR